MYTNLEIGVHLSMIVGEVIFPATKSLNCVRDTVRIAIALQNGVPDVAFPTQQALCAHAICGSISL